VADLAILLEPVYWPEVTDRFSIGGGIGENEFHTRLDEYRKKILHLVKNLDPSFWRDRHESLRFDAGRVDENSELYVLLRSASWEKRDELKGRVSAALWIRHLAEVLRRGFEQAHGERWLEEDQAFGNWRAGARKRAYGSERPFDNPFQSKPYLAYNFGLFTGSAVRWYVEGDTEEHAFSHLLSEAPRCGVELKNLKGIIQSDDRNAALKIRGMLRDDKSQRRFSIISFDRDKSQNLEFIRRQVREGNIVGLVVAHNPDFEFANFAVRELVEVAAQIDESQDLPGDLVRNADWTGIHGMKAFEDKYTKISATKRKLKGETWGMELAKYAIAHPRHPDTGRERPLWRQVHDAVDSWNSSYDTQKERFAIDPVTFEQIARVQANGNGNMEAADNT